MGLTTQDPYIQKEHTEPYKIVKFRVNWANIEQDTAIQRLQNLQRNVWISGQVSAKCMDIRTSVGNPYIYTFLNGCILFNIGAIGRGGEGLSKMGEGWEEKPHPLPLLLDFRTRSWFRSFVCLFRNACYTGYSEHAEGNNSSKQ